MMMYADDTTIYCNIDQNVSDKVINMELSKVSQWLAANKLSLNVTKTKFMVLHMHQKAVTYPDLYLNGNKIERVTQFNYVGLILQVNLSWNKHISHISLKVSKTIGILNRLKSIYPRKVLLTLYNTLILPHFNYWILSWESVLRENHQLHLLQKKGNKNNHQQQLYCTHGTFVKIIRATENDLYVYLINMENLPQIND